MNEFINSYQTYRDILCCLNVCKTLTPKQYGIALSKKRVKKKKR